MRKLTMVGITAAVVGASVIAGVSGMTSRHADNITAASLISASSEVRNAPADGTISEPGTYRVGNQDIRVTTTEPVILVLCGPEVASISASGPLGLSLDEDVRLGSLQTSGDVTLVGRGDLYIAETFSAAHVSTQTGQLVTHGVPR
ncbi:hypothetical protein FRC0360_00102 [Corynebacterium diphtheriae]|nr:hypothetical protein NY055_04640 [Corynebacterium diphtheriae bv. mitis]CAB0842401.1 hypothetical protein FRC0360_00102 [Corynebacterium diphtheriae]